MWLLLFAFLLASSHGQLQQDNQDEDTRPPWSRYDDRDVNNPNYNFRNPGLHNDNLILKEA